MSTAKRKITPKPPRRQSRKARTDRSVDPSIALGLQYFAAWAAYGTALNERDDIQEKLFPLYPPKPDELKAIDLTTRDEILAMPPQRRERLLPLFDEYERACKKIDAENGLTAKEHAADRLCQRAEALLTLWLKEPATSTCGVALKLRAWLTDMPLDPNEFDHPGRTVLAALIDAERICGVTQTVPHARRSFFVAEYAEQVRADFERLGGAA